MTDQRLRSLERRFYETGALEDEVAYLAARRSQADFEVNLRVAAYLGHEAARHVVGLKPVRLKPGSAAEAQIMGRISLAGARAALSAEADPLPFARRALAMAELEQVAPDPDRLFELTDLAFALEGAEITLGSEAVLHSIHHLLGYRGRPSLREVVQLSVPPEANPPGLLRALSWLMEPAAALEAIRAELVPWLLEYSDPLEERVLARRGQLPCPGASPPRRIPASFMPCA